MKKTGLILSFILAFYVHLQAQPTCDLNAKLPGKWLLDSVNFHFGNADPEIERALNELFMTMQKDFVLIISPDGKMYVDSKKDEKGKPVAGTWRVLPDCKNVTMHADIDEPKDYEVISADDRELVLKLQFSLRNDDLFVVAILRKMR